MAEIVIRNTNERITGEENVREFLNNQEVVYEHWNMEKLPAALQENFKLSDDDKKRILDIFDEEIRDLAARRGYKIWDVITLSESTPNIEDLLKNSKRFTPTRKTKSVRLSAEKEFSLLRAPTMSVILM